MDARLNRIADLIAAEIDAAPAQVLVAVELLGAGVAVDIKRNRIAPTGAAQGGDDAAVFAGFED